jgi:DNA repair protein RadC
MANRYTGVQICNPKTVMAVLAGYLKKRQEHFFCITLNGQHEIIKIHVVTIGLASRTVVHPREVFFPAIKDNAVAIIAAHNHPSGKAGPSEEDDKVTAELSKAGEILKIPVLDHVVVAREGYFSYRESGRMAEMYEEEKQ